MRISPKKAREVARILPGKKATEAASLLKYIPRKAARMLSKTLNSAIANAENNANLNSEDLTILEAIVEEGPALKNTIKHHFVENISGLFEKFNHWTHLKALDLIDSKKINNENLLRNIRRVFTRFLKNYYKRRGKEEGLMGFLISLFAGLFPLVSFLRAKIYQSGIK